MILRATGKKGVPQGGVISPWLSNVYLNEVDRMLEKAIRTTRFGQYTYVQYARFADDLVILIDAYRRHGWLVQAGKSEYGKSWRNCELRSMKTRAGWSIWQRERALPSWDLNIAAFGAVIGRGDRTMRRS